MARLEKRAKRYPTDLTDEERERIKPFPPRPSLRASLPGTDLRWVLDASRYMARSGVQLSNPSGG